MKKEISSAISQPNPTPGPYLAKVIGHMDPSYMGGLEVELLRPVGNNSTSGQVIPVKYMSPFYGVTGVDYNKADSTEYNDTQKSYGMWMIPPDPGSTVVVIFIDGDPKRAYWIGCVQDENVNFMIPGLAATEFSSSGKRVPVAEYNKKDTKNTGPDSTKFKKPVHPFAAVLENSGLNLDDVRGITSSSARRETPSAVFGFSTPGPLDKKGPKGKVGKSDCTTQMFVSRKGGSSFVMDDGDDKFVREKPATEAGPVYKSLENDEKGGNVDIPHNELIRIRTRTGHQILLHNSEDLIYISHGSGNSWIEMTANGKIDVYAKDSISFHTENDFNFTADRDINFTAGAQINIKASGNICETGAAIHLNSEGTPAFATVRRPGKEPWAGHENLDPIATAKDKTQTKKDYKAPADPPLFKKYTATHDTFKKQLPPEKK